jgi:uncharacterized protein (TIGR02145 family)
MKKSNVYFAIAFVATFFLVPLLGGVGGGLYAQVGINATGATPNSKSLLDVDAAGMSTKAGLLIPRMTTTERDAIAPGASENSLLIFNTTTQCFEAWNAPSSTWVAFGCIGCQLPGAFTATAASNIASTSFSANWTASAGATTYYLDVSTVSTFATFVTGYNNLNVGDVTTYSVNTNLTCNTTYYYRLRANNSCGTSSNSNTITVTTGACGPTCGTQVWMTANMNTGTQVTQATTQSAGQKWCYNDVAANCTTYGGLYQWASAMNLPSSENSVLHYGTNLPNCDPCGSGGVQGICPAGYHIPTDLEWSRYEYCIENNIAPTGSTTLATFQTTTGWRGSATAGVGPGSKMKVTSSNSPAWDGTNTSGFSALPAGYSFSGTSGGMGTGAYLWSATEYSATNAWIRYLGTGSAQSYRDGLNKTYGFSVRCLQN